MTLSDTELKVLSAAIMFSIMGFIFGVLVGFCIGKINKK